MDESRASARMADDDDGVLRKGDALEEFERIVIIFDGS